MGTVQHLFEGLHAAEFFCDIVVIGDVIAAVNAGRGVEGGEPDAVAAKGLDIIQLLIYAVQVAHAVTVAVLKGTGPDLIEHHVLIPLILCQSHSPIFYYKISLSDIRWLFNSICGVVPFRGYKSAAENSGESSAAGLRLSDY